MNDYITNELARAKMINMLKERKLNSLCKRCISAKLFFNVDPIVNVLNALKN